MIRNPSVVRDLYSASKTELTALKDRRELSSYLITTQMLSKAMLMSCASFYEQEITQIVERIVKRGRDNPIVTNWILKKAVEGQFYKWFNFRSAKNTNPFLAMFGSEFKDQMRELIDLKDWRSAAESSFLLLCTSRNECVHRNFAAYNLELTIDEIYRAHRQAMSYIRLVDYGSSKWLIE